METRAKSKNLQYWMDEARTFITYKMRNMSTSDRVRASRLGKSIVLGINETYKKTKDPELMELMKAVTLRKRTIDKRLKGNLTAA